MFSNLLQVLGGLSGQVKLKLIATYLVLALFNLIAWGWALIAFKDHPVLLGTAMLAYGFGLRHAVDADHIAAIDNVTRKLMQDGQRPATVGFFFSMGHSTVVVLAAFAIALTTSALNKKFEGFKEIGGLIGTSVSALFLLLLALMNLMILRGIYKTWKNVRNGGRYNDEDFDILLADRGILARLFRPMFRLVTRSWHMFPLGFIFGLGFDTASEIAVMGISASQAAQGMSPWSIMVFPLLFSAGMSLVDTLDGHLMLGAYGWAYMNPLRKIYYNMTITLVSVIVAVLISGVEGLGLVADKLSLDGPFWTFIGNLNDHFGVLGYLIIGVFLISWIASMAIYRLKGYDKVELAH